MTSTHEGELHLPSLPLSARHVHIVPALQQFSLISMGQLCDAGCLIAFTASTVTVSFNDDIILTGHRTPATLLWHFDLPVPPSSAASSLAAANATIGSATPAQLVAFAHAALYSPALSTLDLALQQRLPHQLPRPLLYPPSQIPASILRYD
ncbi:MAG: hypothetical protein MZV70_62550 [Desulfobacterales bacterium]|nr:hypothetical protein [Desulfobacterales bacterium]